MNMNKEIITTISLTKIRPFYNHPFRVQRDESFELLKESVLQNGILEPVIVRALSIDNYEMISGHRRMAACKELGLKTIPAIIRDLDDDAATLTMIDANRHREHILPSEKAFAYKIREEALRHQGRKSATMKGKTIEQIGSENNESANTVARFIRLTKLIQPFLQMVDEKKMGITTAVELSFLPIMNQYAVLDAIESEQSVPSLAQAKQLKKAFIDNSFADDTACRVLMNNKGKISERLSIPMAQLMGYFVNGETPAQMIQVILAALEQKKRSAER